MKESNKMDVASLTVIFLKAILVVGGIGLYVFADQVGTFDSPTKALKEYAQQQKKLEK